MASRKELKEQRRREREEAERRELRQQKQRRRLRIYGGAAAVIAVAAGAAAFALLAGGEDDAGEVFAAKPDGLQERVQKAGLTLGPDHFHPTVRVVVNGADVPIPDDIGTGTGGAGHSPIHRHAGDEKLHAEGVKEGAFTLGQFMDVWGVPLSADRLGPYRATGPREVMVLAKRKGQDQFRRVGDVRGLPLRDADEVYVVYGTREQSPIVL